MYRRFFKRFFDIVLSALAIVVVLPTTRGPDAGSTPLMSGFACTAVVAILKTTA